MSVIDVALACGFVSASHFSKCYRDFFGKTPRRERAGPVQRSAVEQPALAGAEKGLGFKPAPRRDRRTAVRENTRREAGSNAVSGIDVIIRIEGVLVPAVAEFRAEAQTSGCPRKRSRALRSPPV